MTQMTPPQREVGRFQCSCGAWRTMYYRCLSVVGTGDFNFRCYTDECPTCGAAGCGMARAGGAA